MREHERNDDDLFVDLYRSGRYSAQDREDIKNALPSAPILRHSVQVPRQPQEGMFVVDPTNPLMPGWCFFRDDKWYCIYPRDPVHAIKIFPDTKNNSVKDGAFRFTIEKDLDNHLVTFVEGGNGTAGSGVSSYTIQNMTRNVTLLNDPVVIAGGAYHSTDGTGEINEEEHTDGLPSNLVFHKNRIWISTLAAGAGSKGMYTFMTFHPYDPDDVAEEDEEVEPDPG